MDKIKKGMTILAGIGTVLVTAVFCYMPIREVIREYQKETVSLEQEQTLGSTEDSAEELKENLQDVTAEEMVQEEALQNVAKTPKVVFHIKAKEEVAETSLYVSEDGIGYVFLPGFAKDSDLQLDSVEDKGYLMLGSQTLHEGDMLTGIVYEEAYEFALYDKEDMEVIRMPLIFLYSSDLPVLMLSTQSESMEAIDALKGTQESGDVILFDADGGLLYSGEAESIEGRGNSTFGLLKKPYKFKLKEDADFFGFGKAKDWNLLADGYDETKLRNPIALGLARTLSMEYTPDGQTVDLYCNGVYYGVYYLCEKIQVGENRVEITDMEEYTRAVYSKTELEELATVVSEDEKRKWTTSEVEADDITGGYLFERELAERYETEKSGFITEAGDAYAMVSPEHATETQVAYLADYVQEAEEAIYAKDGVNKKTGKHYTQYIDVDSFVGKYLLEEVTRNYDGGVTSSFFYKKSDAQGGKLYAGPAWDYDVCLGNCNLDYIVSNPVGLIYLNDHIYGTELFVKLYEKEDFRKQVVQTYQEKVAPYLEALLAGEIDELGAALNRAVVMDSIRWQSLANRYRYYEEYENNLRYLKYYIEKRKAFLDEVWIDGEVYHSITFMVDGQSWKKLYVKDGEVPGEASQPNRYSSLFMGWLSQNHNVPYDGYKPIYEDMVFYATWQQLPVEEVVIVTGTEKRN